MTEVSQRTIHDLSFMTDGSWAPVRSNVTIRDNLHGKECADELLHFMRFSDNPAILGSVIRAITEGGVYEAVEIGFCSRLATHILRR